MLQPQSGRYNYPLLHLAAGLAMLAAGGAGLASMPAGPGRWIALALLLLFALAYWASTRASMRGRPGLVAICVALQTALVLLLCTLDPTASSAASYFSILFFIMSAVVTLFFRPRYAILWIVVFSLVSAGALVILRGLADGLRSSLPNIAGYFFFGAFADALRQAQLARENNARLLEQLRSANEQLQEYAGQVERLVIVEERNRLAREMHDTIGHRLTVAAVQLEGAQRLIPRDPERAGRMVGTVREQVREALNELRRTVATLRQPADIDLPLPEALQQLALSFQAATGLCVHLALPDDTCELPPGHRLALYRAAQEGLTNVQRHARAQDAWLNLSLGGDAVRLTVADNGIGWDPSPQKAGFGLSGLQERAAQLGGHMCVEARGEGGTQISMSLPLPARVEPSHG
jgi:signal transduction histidine kinase